MKIHIIGCGTIGSNLAVQLCKERLASEINIYDNDIITKEELPIFLKSSIGRPKCLSVKMYLRYMKLDTNVKIYTSTNLVVKSIDSGNLVLDCRDRKEQYLKSHLRISHDGNLLCIDTTRKNLNLYNDVYTEYWYKKNPCYIGLCVCIVSSFITSKIWKKKRSLFMYKLDDIVAGKELKIDDNNKKIKRN